MKVLSLLLANTYAVSLMPNNSLDLQLNVQSQLFADAQLFTELHNRLNLFTKDIEGKPVLTQADAEVAKLDADSLNEVITNVHNRWLSSID